LGAGGGGRTLMAPFGSWGF